MEFTKSLIKGKLIKRYKRFFTDVKLQKETVTAVTVSFCNLTSVKNLLYRLINLPFIKDLVNSITKLYI